MALHLVPVVVLTLMAQAPEPAPQSQQPVPVVFQDPAPALQNDPPARAISGADMASGRAAQLLMERPVRNTLIIRAAGASVFVGGLGLGLLGVLGGVATLALFGAATAAAFPPMGAAMLPVYLAVSVLVAGGLVAGLGLMVAGGRAMLFE